MNVAGTPTRSLEFDRTRGVVRIVDQLVLPHAFRQVELRDLDAVCGAICSMQLRGAPLIGAAAAFGLAFALRDDASVAAEERAAAALLATRPTAVNLRWAVRRIRAAVAAAPAARRAAVAFDTAAAIAEEDVAVCSRIGDSGLPLLEARWRERRAAGAPRLNVLTHCNAGWLATVDWGTALAPVYKAHRAGIPVHVWVDETRPRSQGARLTAWELREEGIPCTLLADTAAGHLLQRGHVDIVLVGSDRTTARGDVCNKVGTYGVALAAHDNGVPFHAALPASTVDWELEDGVSGVPIEERDATEVLEVEGMTADGQWARVRIAPPGTRAVNVAFDVTPARLVCGLVTEHGLFAASPEGLAELQLRLRAEAARA